MWKKQQQIETDLTYGGLGGPGELVEIIAVGSVPEASERTLGSESDVPYDRDRL